MKLFIKTSKGTHFEIKASPEDTVADVKKKIEDVQGSSVYRAFRQMLIYQGKVLNDDTRLKDNKVADNGFILLMLTENEGLAGEGSGSTKSSNPHAKKISQISGPTRTTDAPRGSVPVAVSFNKNHKPDVMPVDIDEKDVHCRVSAPVTARPTESEVDVASNQYQAIRSNFEDTVQQIVDLGDGAWNRDIVIQALGAAFNNPELAVEYLYSGYPNVSSNASATPNLGFLRNSHQFQTLRAVVQANPDTLQPMLWEFGKKNPNLMRLIEEHLDEFLLLVNEPVEGGDSNVKGKLDSMMPQAIQVTPRERDAIVRLEGMGFDRALVLEVFFAFDKNEELAANYLVDHMDDF